MAKPNPTGALVNSIYPVSYFTLAGVKKVSYPDNFWWSSKERYAAVDSSGNYVSIKEGGTITSEILEIDLGRVREINYLNFDIIRAPVDITVEYDAISTPDRTPTWREVRQSTDLPFEDSSSFDPQNRNTWLNVELNFTDVNEQLVHARYLRLTFSRRDEVWPTSNAPAFQWPVFIKHLRLGRYVASITDTSGPLLNQDTTNGLDALVLPSAALTTTTEARQQFVIPPTTVRAGLTPNLLGFGFLVASSPSDNATPTLLAPSAIFNWSLFDVTDSAAPVRVRAGTIGPLEVEGQEWVDFYFAKSSIIPGDLTKIYELRVASRSALVCNSVYTHSPNGLSNTSLPGTLTFTNGSTVVDTTLDLTSIVQPGQFVILTDIPDQPLQVESVTSSTLVLTSPYLGATATTTVSIIYPFASWDGTDYVQDASKNLVMRVWSDIADEGQDILGNTYRHIVRRQEAANVFDPSKAGWMSDPSPTPEAVEALYFDVRGANPMTGDKTYSLIEAIEIAPRTPGVRMSIYYSQENLHGVRPIATDEWDNLLWQPTHTTYTLRRDEIIKLPNPVKAAYMKLEFTALNPLPYRLPDFPPLPPRQYRRFPTWIETQFQNAQLKSLIEDWFLRNATPIEQSVLRQLADPVREFEYKQAEFLAALALGTITDAQTVNSGLVDIADKALIDPTTGSKIFIQMPDQYASPLLAMVDQSSILGKMVVQNYDPSVLSLPTENQDTAIPRSSIPVVSTVNDRISQAYQSLAQIPMRFYKPCRHIYTVEQASFNKKAYFVGIDKVRFLRIDYGIAHDDLQMTETLFDDTLLIENTWDRESETVIPDGGTAYVSYQVGDTTITDEEIILVGFNPTELQKNGQPVRNVLIFARPHRQGIQYFQGLDYQLGYDTDNNGVLTTFIERSALVERLTVPLQPIYYQDAYTVIGRGRIPTKTFDTHTVVGIGVADSL